MAALSEDDRRMLDSGDPEINRVRYTVFMIRQFSEGFKRPMQETFNYLEEFGGLEYLDKTYEYEHTQPPCYTALNMLEVCRKNGGWL